MTGCVGVIVVEDHELLADGLCRLVECDLGWRVLTRVANGLDVYRACQVHRPALMLLDLGLPGMDGVDVIHQCMQRWPDLRILVNSASDDSERARQSLDAGARAFVLKSSPRRTLVHAAQQVMRGHRFVDPAVFGGALETVRKPHTPRATRACDVETPEQSLTLRERQVLKLVAEGQRNRDIAQVLSISVKTVETHRLNMMRKLDAHNVADVVNWAHRLGMMM
ncbi:two component system response regulator [Pandoraea nosoerga]|uniref:DNA-binding response regulator n=1 Tax=Pandoraea nosoerga TaxID=2508296 RepID=A0A5E4XHC6_9BURK|nr:MULTISPECIES: two component system response regulator [Pandoraea]MBN4668079.1 two component system response regulator [Pandoraea nosoerga]MBN4677903.1 two component system response regulator [Pandoraea nosoerga]MBN4683107.1 two component system response regulator [Pandoraea nosoerga]MBN4746596.1 two component system response regulator [Pandoraea nosoerga]VVE35520.1 DNA-binding response regulator [Pandoraea nosoerga]